MAEHGYTGIILKIDLSTGANTRIDTEKYTERFLGGRGTAVKIYWEETTPQVKAFDPENPLVF
ncbi:MAG: aldehyde ferredoxin oxidoreductase N-terminal domain-containing protein, partial [Dehalococcoidales bacterium]|nr:aldehyde ferredoxin oxidoreductase N-terminal domain-containing protein [Dehalococcoidales bacterium]